MVQKAVKCKHLHKHTGPTTRDASDTCSAMYFIPKQLGMLAKPLPLLHMKQLGMLAKPAQLLHTKQLGMIAKPAPLLHTKELGMIAKPPQFL